MRRHLNHPAHRARRARPSLLSGVETLRRLEVARLLRRLRAQAAPERLWRLWSASATALPSLSGLGSAHSQVRFHTPCCCEILYLCITTGHPASPPTSRPGHGHHSSHGTSPSQGSACARLPWPSASLAGSRPGGRSGNSGEPSYLCVRSPLSHHEPKAGMFEPILLCFKGSFTDWVGIEDQGEEEEEEQGKESPVLMDVNHPTTGR